MPKITKSPAEIRNDYLRTIKNGLADLGITNANVSENSDYYVQATALADMVSGVYNNIEIQADASFPDTATGVDLDRQLSNYGLKRRSAGGSAGLISIVTSALTLVVTGAQLTSPTGVVYQVTIGGTYSNGGIIPVSAVDVGAKTNAAVTTVLSWTSPPAFTQSTATVVLALKGGVDEEDDETARARLLSRLRNPPASGNWQQVAEIAEEADPSVQKAFIYQAPNGPSTLHVAVIGYPSSSSKSRVIDTIKMNSTIVPEILGHLPEYTEVTVQTVIDEPTDVSVQITLPLAVSSTSLITGPGTGGGWLNVNPFPAVNGTTHYFIPVTVVTDSTHFTINSPANINPIVNITKIQWIDKSEWKIKQATITAFTGTGPYALTIDTPFVGMAVGDWLFPACVNAQIYLDALLSSFKLMGPGEKTGNISIFSRASRRPRPQSAYPFNLDSSTLKAVINSGEEVETASYWYRSKATPSQVATSIVSPTTPTLVSQPARILIPRSVGFYPPSPLE